MVNLNFLTKQSTFCRRSYESIRENLVANMVLTDFISSDRRLVSFFLYKLFHSSIVYIVCHD